MTNITDEKILEFCRAGKGWFWDDDPSKAVNKYTGKFHPRANDVRDRYFETACEEVYKNFSLENPQVYEDGVWYAAKVLKVLNGYIKICCHYNSQLNRFICDGARYSENALTNIRPIPEEMWEGEG